LLFLLTLSAQLVELKNGETYNGNLVSVDIYMNLQLADVIFTSKVSWLYAVRPRISAFKLS
jgi:small nuclear ribonucleoprotein (snRNP)-like protein